MLTVIGQMLVLLGTCSLVFAGRARAMTCYEVTPAGPGWNNVRVDPGHAFAGDVEQFRPGSDAMVWRELHMGMAVTETPKRRGWHHVFTLHLDGVRHSRARLAFWPPLSHVKVSATGFGPEGEFDILDGVRLSGRLVDLDLPPRKLFRLEVVLHTHFRRPPSIEHAWLGSSLPVPPATVPPDFRDGSHLVFYSRDGEEMDLCDGTSGRLEIYNLAPVVPREATLGEPFEKKRHLHRKMLGILVAIGLVGLIIEILRFALKPGSPGAGRARGGSS